MARLCRSTRGSQSQFTRASGDETETVWINKRGVTDAAEAWHDEVIIKRRRVGRIKTREPGIGSKVLGGRGRDAW